MKNEHGKQATASQLGVSSVRVWSTRSGSIWVEIVDGPLAFRHFAALDRIDDLRTWLNGLQGKIDEMARLDAIRKLKLVEMETKLCRVSGCSATHSVGCGDGRAGATSIVSSSSNPSQTLTTASVMEECDNGDHESPPSWLDGGFIFLSGVACGAVVVWLCLAFCGVV